MAGDRARAPATPPSPASSAPAGRTAQAQLPTKQGRGRACHTARARGTRRRGTRRTGRGCEAPAVGPRGRGALHCSCHVVGEATRSRRTRPGGGGRAAQPEATGGRPAAPTPAPGPPGAPTGGVLLAPGLSSEGDGTPPQGPSAVLTRLGKAGRVSAGGSNASYTTARPSPLPAGGNGRPSGDGDGPLSAPVPAAAATPRARLPCSPGPEPSSRLGRAMLHGW